MIKSYLSKRLARNEFVRSAIEDQADLSAFRERPDKRIIFGLFLMGFSYIIGWPAISVLGAIAVYAKKPLILAIGGPVTYGLSHLVFIAGMYFAGNKYAKIFLRWAARMMAVKIVGIGAASLLPAESGRISPKE